MLARALMLVLSALLVLATAVMFRQAWSDRQMRLELDQTIQELRDAESRQQQITIPPAGSEADTATPGRPDMKARIITVDARRQE